MPPRSPGRGARYRTIISILWTIVLFLILAVLYRQAFAEDIGVPAQRMRTLFKRLDASVVTVNSAHVVEHTELLEPFDASAFSDYMRSHLQVEGGTLSATIGSGFIISPDGLIITAAHVLQDSVSVLVELHDHRLLPAQIIGLDFASDLALLKVEAKNLPPVRFGDAAPLLLGDALFSIGAPFGLAHTVSAGMVSGAGRVVAPDSGTLMIQTDLPVNPGSSGSPLFNRHGQVVGMNTIIFTYDGGFNGVSLAVPAELLRAAIDRIRRGAASPRGIGARFRDLPPILAHVLGIDRSAVITVSVEPDGQAMSGGLMVGDVIVECDGQAVNSVPELLTKLAGNSGKAPRRLKIVRERQPAVVQLPSEFPGM